VNVPTGPADLRPPNLLNGRDPVVPDQPLIPTPVPTIRRYRAFDARTGEPGPEHVRQDFPDGTKRLRWEPTGAKPADYWYGDPDDYPAGAEIVIAEGEKATEAIREAGYRAIGTMAGAATPPSDAALALIRHRPVVLWPDHDEPGEKLMHTIAARLEALGHDSVRYVGVPADMPDHGDAADLHDKVIAGLIDSARKLGLIPPTAKSGLRFYSPLDLAELTTTTPSWAVGPGLMALGAITELDGKIKAAGKTTLYLHIVRAVLDGSPFLGQPTRHSKVVYVTEQARHTFMDALRLVGLTDRGDELRILFREDIGATPWPEVVSATRIDGYELVIFDTIGKLSGIKEENSAGEWAVAMSPLQDLAASGRAVGIARHDRKSGGQVGDSGRGSSQASGDVDIILALRRPEGNQSGNRRVIESLSRYRETPEKIVVELTDAGYVLLGSAEAVATADARLFVSDGLRSLGVGVPTETKEDDLVERGKLESPPVTRWAIRSALAAMVASGEIFRYGQGKRGDPFVYSSHQREREFLMVLRLLVPATNRNAWPACSTRRCRHDPRSQGGPRHLRKP
jgi:hypothetical protein